MTPANVWVAPQPPYLGEEGTEQFTVTTELNGLPISTQKIHDPFIRTTVTIGWWELLRALLTGLLFWGKLKVNVRVSGSHAAQRRIMTMNPVEMQMENEQWEQDCAARSKAGSFLPGDTAQGIIGVNDQESVTP